MDDRVCRSCGNSYPATYEYFNWQDKKVGRLKSECRECERHKRTLQRQDIKENNPELYRKMLEKQRNYYQRTKKERMKTTNEWRRANPDKVKYYFDRRRKVRYAEDPVYKWTHTARCAVRRAAKCKGVRDQRSSSFLEDITGLPLLPLHNHLLKSFEDAYGYAWDRKEKVEVDHIIPLCTESTIEGRQRLFHYTNLRLIKAIDNKAKGMTLDYEIGKGTADSN